MDLVFWLSRANITCHCSKSYLYSQVLLLWALFWIIQRYIYIYSYRFLYIFHFELFLVNDSKSIYNCIFWFLLFYCTCYSPLWEWVYMPRPYWSQSWASWHKLWVTNGFQTQLRHWSCSLVPHLQSCSMNHDVGKMIWEGC